MRRSKSLILLLSILALIALGFLMLDPADALAAPRTAGAAVSATWQEAQARGAYEFSADIRQEIVPRATVTNVGRQTRVDTLHLEGSTDIAGQELIFSLWSQGGSIFDASSGAQVRVDETGAFARQGTAEWEPIPDFSASFAPNGDFLAYLEAARNFQEAEQGNRAGVAYTRYTFELDGPALAARMRDQLQEKMAAQGELPAGASLALPELYAYMTGIGELWVGTDGLPLRQRLDLQFPETESERISAEVDVTFSGFASPDVAVGPTDGLLTWLGQSLPSQVVTHSTAARMALLLLAGSVFAVLVNPRRPRRLYAAATSAFLVTLIFTPLLQGAQAARVDRRQAERQAQQAAWQEESELQRVLRSTVTEPDPTSPTPSGPEALALIAADDGTDSDADGFSDVQEQLLGSNTTQEPPAGSGADPLRELLLEAAASQADADLDGLTDYQETLLGTNPYETDSDGDLLPDPWEVEGFEYAGQHWYTDPLDLDSNRDGLGDTREWLAGQDEDELPGDTDGDGVPDLFDPDNDGDGVPDRLDVSPFARSEVFNKDEPLALIFNDLEAGQPALIDFQLRPEDADHLWYAFNVLDWPEGDAEGQVQDVDGQTFADVTGRGFMDREANGDLRLVPMLEIQISGPLTHLPSPDEQEQMGLKVHSAGGGQEGNQGEQLTYVYLPLKLVIDPDGDAQVAFEVTMLYRPEFKLWGSAHQVRLAWMLQALVDVCVEFEGPDASGNEVDCAERENNQPQILHTYYEPWFLTGLDVREDHGVELAILYEDPAVDPEPHDDDGLMMLAGGLSQTFLAARDADGDGQGDGQLDLTVDEIARRFDQDSQVSSTDRWAVPDIIRVARHSYDHRAEALGTIVMTDTRQVLEQSFTPFVEANEPVTPTLMFAREERFRAANLDSQEMVSWQGSALTIDLGGSDVPMQTVAGLSWAPFRYQAESQGWEAMPIDTYWDELAARYPFAEEADPEIASGKQFALQMLYLALYAGLTEPIQFDEDILPSTNFETDESLEVKILEYTLSGVSYLINGYVGLAFEASDSIQGFTWREWAKVKELFKRTQAKLSSELAELRTKFKSVKILGTGAFLNAVVMLLQGLLLFGVFSNASLAVRVTLAALLGTLLLWLDVLNPVLTAVRGVLEHVKNVSGLLNKLRAAPAWLKTSAYQTAAKLAKFAAVVAFVVSTIVLWVDFFTTIVKERIEAGSIQFNVLLSRAISGTLIAAAALALVFAFPIAGTIVLAIVGLWDLIMTIVGLDNLVLTDIVTKFLADVIYGVDSTLEEPDITLEDRQMNPADPNLGLIAGNDLSVGMTVTTHIRQNTPRHNVTFYQGRFYSPENLASTVFRYQLNAISEIEGQSWSPRPSWNAGSGRPWQAEALSQVPAVALPLEGPGINRVVPYNFQVSYDIPGWECWGISALAYCQERRITGDNATTDTSIVLDVFPATLDEFYQLDWGDWQAFEECPPKLDTTDLSRLVASTEDLLRFVTYGGRCGQSFPDQQDHDGDGLLAQAVGGFDPDDSRWDFDGDGLSDRFEMELGEEGQGTVLHLSADSDGDGLCDDQEIHFGTDPGLEDSDGDGLGDGQEVFHPDRCDMDADGDTAEWLGGWRFVYGGSPLAGNRSAGSHISSNPRLADGDGDGLDDLAEKRLHQLNPLLYPYHPAVYNETPVALYSSLSDDDRVLAPGQRVAYTATVRNSLSVPLFGAGALTVTVPSALGGEQLELPFNLYQDQQQSIFRALQVAPGASSVETSIAQALQTRLHTGDRQPLFTWLPPATAEYSQVEELPISDVAVAVPGQNWTTSHLVALLSGRDEVEACGGDIACSTGAIELLTLDDSGQVSQTLTVDAFVDYEYFLAGKQTDLTCNAAGICLLVYARPFCDGEACQPSQTTVMGALLRPNIIEDPAPFPISSPEQGVEGTTAKADAALVATNGTSFLVIWQETGDGDAPIVKSAQVSADETVSAPQTIDLADEAYLLDLAWAGGRYLLAWSAVEPDGGRELRLGGMAIDGQITTEPILALTSLPLAEVQAAIAADPDRDQALIIYTAGTEAVEARLLSAGELSPEIPLWDGGAATAPQVAYDPSSEGWLVSWLAAGESGQALLHYQALEPGGGLRLGRQSQAVPGSPPGSSLACGGQGPGCLVALPGPAGLSLLNLALDPYATILDSPLPIVIDADPPTSTVKSLQNGQYISATGTLIVGGQAADLTSKVAQVAVDLNGQPCPEAAGAAIWSAACQVPESDGALTITSRASDVAGNQEGAGVQITVILDRQPPQITSGIGTGPAVRAEPLGEDSWLLPLAGQVLDPAAGAAAGSGVIRVEARLNRDKAWQTAEITGTGWELDYRLPAFDADFNLLAEPSGSYTFTLRAVDAVGNRSVAEGVLVQVDNRAPVSTLVTLDEETDTISQTLTLSGRFTETGQVQAGLAGLEVALTEADFVISPTVWLPADLAQTGPGVLSTTWDYTVPAGLEGIYQMDVRGRDVLGNQNEDRGSWTQWRGEIDTLAPRTALTITYSGAGSAAQTIYQAKAEDFNLSTTDFEALCPLAAADRIYYSSPWWEATIRDQTRLYQLMPSCRVPGFQESPVSVEACDVFGRCTTAQGDPPAAYQPPTLHSAVLDPAHETVLATDEAVELTVGAFAAEGLAALTVLVDGVPVASQEWDGDGPVEAQWAATWQPPGEGNYTLTSIVTDTLGQVQSDVVTTLVGVDLAPPQVGLETTVLTATQRLAFGRVDLAGSATDTVGVAVVEVQIEDGPWQPAVLRGDRWIYPWLLGEDLDGQAFTIGVRAIDGAGRVDQLNQEVIVDVLPPDPEELGLMVDLMALVEGQFVELQPGETVRDAEPILIVNWSVTDDGTGIASYHAGWSSSPTPTAAGLTRYTAAGQHQESVQEPQALYAHLIIQDDHGNSTSRTFGPVYVDGPATPDYVADLGYDGWLKAEATQIGVDWAVSRRAATGSGLDHPQRLFASWDEAGLRVTWTGANWNRDGDLFIYLDTVEGGANQLFNPYLDPDPTITLPEGLAADYLVQVEDARRARLWRWVSQEWVGPVELLGNQFDHDTTTQPGQTDLYLPFIQLGIADPANSELKLLAVASEEEALRLWATIPDKNPLNSQRAIDPAAAPFVASDYGLTQYYAWESLDVGQVPNGGREAGANLRMTIEADPPGVAVGYLASNLPQLRPGSRLDDGLDGRLDPTLPFDTNPPPLANGEVVTYTIRYANMGEAAAGAMRLELAAFGALHLPGTTSRDVDLGDIAPGISGTVVVTGTIDVSRTQNIQSAELDVTLSDEIHGPFDWLWAQHDLDVSPPQLDILSPETYVAPGPLEFQGTVKGVAEVQEVTLAIQTWLTGTQGLTFCADMTIRGDRWSCRWEPGEELSDTATDGAELFVQARATDTFGRQSEWTDPLRLTVDLEPPAVRLSAETETALEDGFLNAGELNLTGIVSDTGQANQLQVCREGEEEEACERIETPEGVWHIPVTAAEDADGLAQTLALQGIDTAGNRSQALELNYQVDGRPPQVTVTEQLTTTVLPNVITTVLTGTVMDGSEMPTVTVRLVSPSEPAQLTPAVVDDQRWTFAFLPEVPGVYQLIVEGSDRAGNTSILPAVPLTVTQVAKTAPAPVPADRPATASTQITRQFVPGLKQGGFIKLVVEPGLPGLWSRVQWRDASGHWREVDGWRGTYYRDNEVLWWVSAAELGTGPYRWVLSGRPDGPDLFYSTHFFAPEQRGEQVTIQIWLN